MNQLPAVARCRSSEALQRLEKTPKDAEGDGARSADRARILTRISNEVGPCSSSGTRRSPSTPQEGSARRSCASASTMSAAAPRRTCSGATPPTAIGTMQTARDRVSSGITAVILVGGLLCARDRLGHGAVGPQAGEDTGSSRRSARGRQLEARPAASIPDARASAAEKLPAQRRDAPARPRHRLCGAARSSSASSGCRRRTRSCRPERGAAGAERGDPGAVGGAAGAVGRAAGPARGDRGAEPAAQTAGRGARARRIGARTAFWACSRTSCAIPWRPSATASRFSSERRRAASTRCARRP